MAHTAVETVPLGPASDEKRFIAATVFGVVVTLRNVTVFMVSMSHDPVNVHMRKTLPPPPPSTLSHVGPLCPRSPCSTSRTTRAIRSAAPRVKSTRAVDTLYPSHDGGVPKYVDIVIRL